MLSVQEIILLFTKYPQAGSSKTRLIPSLGPQGAADLQRRMTLMATARLKKIANHRPCDIEIHHDGGTSESMQQWLGPLPYWPQQQGDLGVRMASAIRMYLKSHRSIVLIGSDCPGIDELVLNEALDALRNNETVIGPAFDGGYYLIGVQGKLSQKVIIELFTDMQWGSKNVLRETLQKIQRMQLSCHLLKKLHDIDTPEDLRHLNYYPHTQ